MTTALIVDSSALLTPDLVAATGAIVVPITVTIDGVDHLDGVELSADDFYQRLADTPEVPLGTAQPSPARFLDAFTEAHEAGASSVVAVLVGSAFSGTVDAARVAAARSPIPVTCVDTGQASFGIALCALRAADALATGAGPAEAGRAARELSDEIESVFIVQALELARASGRFGALASALDGPIPVLVFAGGELTVAAEVTTPDEAVDAMAAAVLGTGRRIRVASGLADPATAPITEALEQRLEASDLVTEILRYRVGPAVAANTGPGTAGVFLHPV